MHGTQRRRLRLLGKRLRRFPLCHSSGCCGKLIRITQYAEFGGRSLTTIHGPTVEGPGHTARREPQKHNAQEGNQISEPNISPERSPAEKLIHATGKLWTKPAYSFLLTPDCFSCTALQKFIRRPFTALRF